MDGKTITLEVKHLAEEAAHIWSEVGIFEWKQENTLSTKETIKKRRKKERKQALDQETIRNFLLFLIVLLVKSLFSFFSFFLITFLLSLKNSLLWLIWGRRILLFIFQRDPLEEVGVALLKKEAKQKAMALEAEIQVFTSKIRRGGTVFERQSL